jgi:hypothetical protein
MPIQPKAGVASPETGLITFWQPAVGGRKPETWALVRPLPSRVLICRYH